MSIPSIPPLIMVGITAYVGLYHLMIYLRQRQQRQNLTFALMSLSVSLYTIFCVGLYNVTSVEDGVQWQRRQVFALALLTMAFLWFAADVTARRHKWGLYLFSAYFILAATAQIAFRNTLTWDASQPLIKHIVIPLLGLSVTYYEATPGPITDIQSVMGLLAGLHILWGGARLYRSGNRKGALPLLLGVGCFFVGAVNDTLVSSGVYQFVYTMEYAYGAMVLLITGSLSSAVVEAAMLKEASQRYAARLQTLREIDQAILAAETPQAIAQAALGRLRALIPCQRVSVALFNSEHNEVKILSTHANGLIDPDTGAKPPSREYSLASELIHSDISVIDNLALLPQRSQAQQALLSEGIHSIISVPLIFEDEPVGSLNLEAARPSAFNEEQIEIAREVADQLGIAVQQAHLHEQVLHHAVELEQRVTARTAELTTANEQLRVLSQVKDVFVSNVSHELRTPIASLKLYLHLLNRRPEKRASYIASLKREVNRLNDLIEGLLMLSRLDQDRAEMCLTSLDLNMMVRSYVADRIPLAESRKLTLTLDLTPELPGIKGDRGLLEQVLGILLTNALNYTPQGGLVRVNTCIDQDNAQCWSVFCVADNGPGISPEEQSHLFERFYRGKAARESKTPGTGLGLAIAMEIVRRHQGRIEMHCDGIPGHGVQFSVWLPAEMPLMMAS